MLSRPDGEAEVGRIAEADTLQGLVINEVESLPSDSRELLEQSCPGIDLERCWIVEAGWTQRPAGAGEVRSQRGGVVGVSRAAVGEELNLHAGVVRVARAHAVEAAEEGVVFFGVVVDGRADQHVPVRRSCRFRRSAAEAGMARREAVAVTPGRNCCSGTLRWRCSAGRRAAGGKADCSPRAGSLPASAVALRPVRVGNARGRRHQPPSTFAQTPERVTTPGTRPPLGPATSPARSRPPVRRRTTGGLRPSFPWAVAARRARSRAGVHAPR